MNLGGCRKKGISTQLLGEGRVNARHQIDGTPSSSAFKWRHDSSNWSGLWLTKIASAMYSACSTHAYSELVPAAQIVMLNLYCYRTLLYACRKHLEQLVQQQLKPPAAKPASEQKSRVAFVRSHPLPTDASCCSDAAADAIRAAAAAAAVDNDEAATDDAASSSAGQLDSSCDRGSFEQQFMIEQLQQVSASCSRAAADCQPYQGLQHLLG